MGKRVLQADGSYCYTENCRIHDRGDDNFTGSAAVIRDNERNTYALIAERIAGVIKNKLPEIPTKQVNNISNKLVDDIYNTSETLPSELAQKMCDLVYGENAEIAPAEWQKFYEAGHMVNSELIVNLTMKPGDEVIIRETGERGIVTEGSSFAGSRVRVSTENASNNDFKFFEPQEVAKIQPNTKGLARELIVNSPRDILIHKSSLYDLLNEETSADTRNAQGLHGLTPEEAVVVRAQVMEEAEKFQRGYSHDTLTKSRIIKFISEEAKKPNRTWLDEHDRALVQGAFTRILNYIEPKPSA